MDGPIDLRGDGPAPWPAGTTCSLCLVSAVTSATVHLEIAKHGTGDAAGGHHEWSTVSVRSCDECRDRVVGLTRVRWTALPFVVVGTVAWVFALVSEAPLRVWGVAKLEAIMLSTLVCAFVVGVPLYFVDRANDKVRKKLESSWLLRRLQQRLGHPGGALAPELWKVVSEAPSGAHVVEATDVLRP